MFLVLQQQHGQLQPLNTNVGGDNGNYPGKVRRVYNSDGTVRFDVWAYNGTGGALTAGRPYLLTFGSALATILKVAVPTTNAEICNQGVIALEATANATWGWFAIAGVVKSLALVDGTTDVAAGDHLEVTNGLATALQKDGTALSSKSFAVALAAQAADSAVATDILLIGKIHQVAAT